MYSTDGIQQLALQRVVVFHNVAGIAVPESSFYTLSEEIIAAAGAECRGTTCYNTRASDFPDVVSAYLALLFLRFLRLFWLFSLCIMLLGHLHSNVITAHLLDPA